MAFVYFGAAKLGLSLAYVNESASPVWPPTGIAIAALLLLGPRFWPAVLVGAFAANLTTTGNPFTSAAISVGNALEAYVAATLVQRYARGVHAFERAGDAFRFVALAAVLAPLVSTAIGVLTLQAAGLVAPGTAATVAITWWLGDAVGALVVAPAIVLWGRPRGVTLSRRERIEAAALYVSMLVLAGVLFSDPGGATDGRFPTGFIFVPFLVWAAFRFGARESATLMVLLSAVAVSGTADGRGAFAVVEPNLSLLLLQAFIGIGAIVSLGLAALVRERRAVEADLRRSRDDLEQRVAERTASLRQAIGALEQEIVERRRMEETLRRSQDALLDAQKIARLGSWSWDVPSNRIEWSDELFAIYGLDPKQIPASYENFLKFVHPSDRANLEAAVAASLASHTPFELDHRIVRPNGEVRLLHARGRVTLGPDGAPLRMSGTGQDVTELRGAEMARREADAKVHEIERLESLDKFKTQFMNTAAHELGTPLTPILLQVHMLRRRPHSPDEANSLTILERNVQRLRTLVGDLLDGSRLQAGRMTLRRVRVDLALLVREAVRAYEAGAKEADVSLVLQCEPDLWVDVDPVRIGQVLDNLLSNAIKFTPPGGRVEVTGQHGGDGVVVRVKDTGVGIQDSDLGKIFQPFSRVATHGDHVREGTGLGLYLSKGLIDLHEGAIGVDSQGPGQGSTFSFVLPAVDRPGAAP